MFNNYFLELQLKRLRTKIKLLEEKNGKNEEFFFLHQKKYQYIVNILRNRIKENKKIRVAFFVMLDSTFSSKPLFEKMLENKYFKPFIVIIPDTSRGEEHMLNAYNQAYSSLSKKYRNVYKGYNLKTKLFTDYSSKIDMIIFHTPYKNMSHPYFEIDHFLDKNILPLYISYTFSTSKFLRKKLKLDSYSLFWKIFVESKTYINEYKKYQVIKAQNTIVSGFCKMDDLVNQKIISKKRKLIILAPHHTIIDWKSLKISNFLEYANFFLKLPKLYPQIDFIFRPHPLLITQLKRPEIWGSQKTEQYIKQIKNNPNCFYSHQGDYFSIFANSDGIIHDCVSFIAEYLITGKPACYILKNHETIKKWFIPFGQKCLSHHYKAFNEKDIIKFINSVIIKNNDYMKNERINFTNKYLKTNYPNVSQVILNYIKKELCIK